MVHAVRYLVRIVALCAAYVLAAKLGLALDAVSGFASLVWPSTGIALAALLLGGLRLWPGVALGALAINLWNGAPLLAALAIAIGNTLEAVLGAMLMRHLGGFRDTFDRLRHALALVLLAAMAATTVSATVGTATLSAAGLLETGPLETWRAWWLGDATGAVVVGALALAWAGARPVEPTLRTIAEVVALGALLVLVAGFVFFDPVEEVRASPMRVPALVFPIVFLVALRFRLRGATAATFVTAAIAIAGTSRGDGPFARASLAESLVALQVYVGMVGVTALLVGATISEWARAVRGRDDLVAVVSHDLKSPLQALRTSGAIVRRLGCAERADPRVRRHLELVERSTERMTAIIRDLLDARAIDIGHFSLERRDEELCALVDEAVEQCRPAAIEKRIAIRVEKQRGALWASCDRDRVLRVLSNLVGNAVKYTPEGGRIRVTVAARPGEACVSIADTGVGMSPAALRRAFDPYFRAEPRAGEGSGLGLYIAKAIVLAHGGRIWGESAPGAGSAFHFTLPMSAASLPHAEPPARPRWHWRWRHEATS